jgi:hypothetical protein
MMALIFALLSVILWLGRDDFAECVAFLASWWRGDR